MIRSVVYEAGSARALLPVIRDWSRQSSVPILAHAAGPAAEIFRREGWPFEELHSGSEVEHLIDSSNELLLTGTSWFPENEFALWDRSRAVGVPSLAVLDNWGDIRRRFSSPDSSPGYDRLPNAIAVMDTVTRDQMSAEGCPLGIIYCTGQPALDLFADERAFDRGDARQRLGLTAVSETIILFVNEAIVTSYGSKPPMSYTDETVLQDLLKSIEQVVPGQARVYVKQHPAETTDRSSSILAEHPNVRSELVCGDGRTWAAAADLVVGTTSILILEAALMGRPVCSHRPGCQGLPLMMKANRNLIQITTNSLELHHWLDRNVGGKDWRSPSPRQSQAATERVTRLCADLIRDRG